MKKVLASLVLISCLTVLAFPLVVNAAEPNTCTPKRTITIEAGGQTINCGTSAIPIDGPNGICCVLNTMYNISDWIFVLLVGIAGIFIIIGAMNLVMAAGSPDKVKSGRDYIMFAAIGLFVAFIARAIPGLVLMVIK